MYNSYPWHLSLQCPLTMIDSFLGCRKRQEQSANKRLFIYETPRRKAHRSESAFPDNCLFRRGFLPCRKCLRREDAAKIHIFPIMNQEKMKKSIRTSSFFLDSLCLLGNYVGPLSDFVMLQMLQMLQALFFRRLVPTLDPDLVLIRSLSAKATMPSEH